MSGVPYICNDTQLTNNEKIERKKQFYSYTTSFSCCWGCFFYLWKKMIWEPGNWPVRAHNGAYHLLVQSTDEMKLVDLPTPSKQKSSLQNLDFPGARRRTTIWLSWKNKSPLIRLPEWGNCTCGGRIALEHASVSSLVSVYYTVWHLKNGGKRNLHLNNWIYFFLRSLDSVGKINMSILEEEVMKPRKCKIF